MSCWPTKLFLQLRLELSFVILLKRSENLSSHITAEMLLSALLLTLAAVPALSAPVDTPFKLVPRRNEYTAWEDPELWLRGMEEIQTFK